ncbi:MAG: VOC family protein [Tunicatimonas sp.]
MLTPFHLAFPVSSLIDTRQFYETLLGCSVGRTSERWIDFNFYGHQITAHLKPEEVQMAQQNEVDGDQVPVRHFGAILEWNDWEALAKRLEAEDIEFIIKPHVRFKGEVGEQATMFFLDPSGNALEFKSFKDQGQVFAT